jgi:hypothetical protein
MTAVLVGELNAQWPLPKMGLLGELRRKSIVGSWEETVRFPSTVPVPQQRSVMSFHDGGTVVSSGQGIVTLNPPPGSVESDSLGAWVQLDWRTFGYTNVAVLSDLDGNLTGFFKVRGVYKLDNSGTATQATPATSFSIRTTNRPTHPSRPVGYAMMECESAWKRLRRIRRQSSVYRRSLDSKSVVSRYIFPCCR